MSGFRRKSTKVYSDRYLARFVNKILFIIGYFYTHFLPINTPFWIVVFFTLPVDNDEWW